MFNLKAKFMLAAVILVIGVSAASAQLSNGSVMKVNVPNAFVLRDETFPAGLYTIERTPNTADSPSLLILRGEGDAMIFDTMIARTQGSRDTELVFDTIDGVNYLSAIHVKGQTVKNEIVKTKAHNRRLADSASVVKRTVLTISDTSF